ncbi:hypothetical protein ACHAXN_001111 [Cyclotella atomus]
MLYASIVRAPSTLRPAFRSILCSALIEQSNRFDRRMCTSLLNLQNTTSSSDARRLFHSSPSNLERKRSTFNKKSKPNGRAGSKPKSSKEQPQPNSKRERKFNKIMKRHEQANPKQIPPAYLTRTASPNVYIAKSAIMDEATGELYVDPTTLFSEFTKTTRNTNNKSNSNAKKRHIIPHIFRQSHLQYFSPASFPNHEPPTDGTPEVAFLGRSNTGKSSLINALHSLILKSGGGGNNNKTAANSGGGELARTSKTPGRTQTINYFGLVPNNNKAKSSNSNDVAKAKLFLVDLPGFGYAFAPDESVDVWQKRTQQFLISRSLILEERGDIIQPWGGNASKSTIKTSRNTKHLQPDASSPPLKRLYLLMDSRLPEPQYLDLSVMRWCDDYSIPYTVVLTKVDGSSRAHCVKLTNQLCMRYHSLLLDVAFSEDEEVDYRVYMDPVVYWTSSKDGLGMEELLSSVEGCLLDGGDDNDGGDEGSENVESGVEDDLPSWTDMIPDR